MVTRFVLDTNVLIEDPDAIFHFKGKEIVIPIEVLKELDGHKDRHDLVGVNVRKAIRNIDDLRQHGWLSDGITTEEVNLRVTAEQPGCQTNDEAIIKAAIAEEDCELITNDINMRVLAGVSKIQAHAYEWNGHRKAAEVYSGVARIEVMGDEITQLFKNRGIDLDPEIAKDLYPNQFLVLKNSTTRQSAIARFKDGHAHTLQVEDNTDIGIRPKNKEQQFALELLLDPDVPLVSLIGKAGCGKSLLAVAAGLHQIRETGTYDSMVVSRPIQPMGKDIGYLPGSLEEKMNPWIQPIRDSLHFLVGKDKRTVDLLFEDGTIEIEALTYIRGRSIPRTYVLIDEAQNLSVPEMKAIVTRIGIGSKIVITGDIEQVDSHRFDSHTNGLAYLVEKMKSQEVSGHVTLLKGERSELATIASRIL